MKYVTVTVEVTAEDIARGRPTHDRCPLARAIRREGFRGVAVIGPDWFYGTESIGMPLSRSAERFISDFDAGLPVQPARFRLRIPA